MLLVGVTEEGAEVRVRQRCMNPLWGPLEGKAERKRNMICHEMSGLDEGKESRGKWSLQK